MIKNAKIFKVGADPMQYHKPGVERGNLAYPMSSSALREFAKNPQRWIKGYTPPDSEAKDWGNLLDTLALTPGLFNTRYAIQPATYRHEKDGEKDWNNNATVCRTWNKDMADAGREVVKSKEVEEAQKAVRVLHEDREIHNFIEASDCQVWIEGLWRDEDTGLDIPVRCLIDLMPRPGTFYEKWLGDLKSTKNAGPAAWERWCHAVGYEIQAAWNIDLAIAATGRELVDFAFILSENFPPYATARRFMEHDLAEPNQDQGDIASGRAQYVEMMALYAQCLKTGKWPGYNDVDMATGGWLVVAPNPFDIQRRQFAAKFGFEDDEPPAAADDIHENGIAP